MRFAQAGKTAALIALLSGAGFSISSTAASAHHRYRHGGEVHYRFATFRAHSLPVLQCVAFAKEASDVQLPGNAVDWWDNAAGLYARGQRPEIGSVLSFQANGRMPLGHVAVVSDVVDSRNIVIDQSHWNSRGVTRNISVVDVSEANDWSAVRVELAHADTYGSIYPTNGFIYPRADQGHLIVAQTHAPMPRLDAAPADLREDAAAAPTRGSAAFEEVAMAPAGIDLTISSADAPNRSLR